MTCIMKADTCRGHVNTCYDTVNRGFCNLIDHQQTRLISADAQKVTYRSGEVVSMQGDRSERIGVIASGLVKLMLLAEHGSHHLLQLLKPGQIVGDPFRPENTFSWEAATRTEICWLKRPLIEKVIGEDPHVSAAYLQILANQLEEHCLWTAAMRGRNTVQRLAFWLSHQFPTSEKSGGLLLKLVLSRRDLAALLDMSVETLCRALHELANKGAIEIPKPDKLEIINVSLLNRLAQAKGFYINVGEDKLDASRQRVSPFCISQTYRKSALLQKSDDEGFTSRIHGVRCGA